MNPRDLDSFLEYVEKGHSDMPIAFYKQEKPLGEAHAVFCATHDIWDADVPLLIILGDQIPVASSAKNFMSFLSHKPSTNMIATHKRENIKNRTWIVPQKGSDKYIQRFVEVRTGAMVPGIHLSRSGFDFVTKASALYPEIHQVVVNDETIGNEHRLISAYQRMLNAGIEFKMMPVNYLSVGDPENIEKTIQYFERIYGHTKQNPS